MGCRHSCVIAGEVIQEIHDEENIFRAGDDFDGDDVDRNLCAGDDDAGCNDDRVNDDRVNDDDGSDDADSKAGKENRLEGLSREVHVASAA